MTAIAEWSSVRRLRTAPLASSSRHRAYHEGVVIGGPCITTRQWKPLRGFSVETSPKCVMIRVKLSATRFGVYASYGVSTQDVDDKST